MSRDVQVLADRWRDGDVQAGAELLEEMDYLIRVVAYKTWRQNWRTPSVSFEDVLQDCRTVILEMARNARVGGVFLAYIKKAFAWEVRARAWRSVRVTRLERDPPPAGPAEPATHRSQQPEELVLLGELWGQLTEFERRSILTTAGLSSYAKDPSEWADARRLVGTSEAGLRRGRLRARRRAEKWQRGEEEK